MRYLIVGGTGTLGQELIKQLSDHDITCLSRCELKQKELKSKYPNVKCVLGDIRDKNSIAPHVKDTDMVFHVAALKHIDILEENPEESVRTNILGTMNVASLGKRYGKRVIFCSTDKAQYPINVYGQCKAVSEKIILESGHTCMRWGNILGSRGSAIHYFVNQIKSDQPIKLTDAKMTRFWLKIEDAAKFMIANRFYTGKNVLIPPMKAASVLRVIMAIEKVCNKKSDLVITGLRRGEKINEDITETLSSYNAPQYTDEELVELVREFV